MFFYHEPNTSAIARQLTEEAAAPYKTEEDLMKPAHLWPSLSASELEEVRTVVYDRIYKVQTIQINPQVSQSLLQSLTQARDYLDHLINEKTNA